MMQTFLKQSKLAKGWVMGFNRDMNLFLRGWQVVLVFFTLFGASQAWAWGERGHFVVGKFAARTMSSWTEDNEQGRAVAKFFVDRELSFGHLSNIPDTEWKNPLQPRLRKMNSGNHYVGPEEIIGPPLATNGPLFEQWLDKVRNLETNYLALKTQLQGKAPLLPGQPQDPVEFYSDVGTTPWRAQQLFNVMVEAFRCAKGKQPRETGIPGGAYPNVGNPFREPADKIGETDDPPLPTYVCNPLSHSAADLYAAVVAGGVLSHFVGDQAQPLHPTADYDGWRTGNGGLHAYFESMVVQALDPSLELEVYRKASNSNFRNDVWSRLGVNLNQPEAAVKLFWQMAADSVALREKLLEIDDTVAVLPGGKGLAMPWGDHPRFHTGKSFPPAQRRPAEDASVVAGFRDLIVERLATATVVLSKMWHEAYVLGGSPDLSAYHGVALPFPNNPPFIWPDFDLEYLGKAKLSNTEKALASLTPADRLKSGSQVQSITASASSPKRRANPPEPRVLGGKVKRCGRWYPKTWWEPVKEEMPDWEIPPDRAQGCEVILSKRNELGILSNFAATPFRYRGKNYASLEGFWQMMKYPESDNPSFDDPRKKLTWPHTREEVANMTAFEAKTAGDAAKPLMDQLGIQWLSFEGEKIHYKGSDQQRHYELIYEATWEKVKQNKQVRDVLLKTGNLQLKPDHTQNPGSPPAYSYFEIYMKIRKQLQGSRLAAGS